MIVQLDELQWAILCVQKLDRREGIELIVVADDDGESA